DANTIQVAEVEQRAIPPHARPTGSAAPEPPAPLLVEPAPEQTALTRAEMGAFAGLSPAAAAVVALSPKSCRFPIGDPQDRDFRFCDDPVVAPPYCERH